ncbi:hypothetical protein [Helicobacter sp. L8]|uniref:hypothetical protein n=1 Tax=Helicobacter sp. L8 TaxID=2316078 RepID=UPI000EB0B7A7|nr:hypothetical protein [Helicobacter sp. L8]
MSAKTKQYLFALWFVVGLSVTGSFVKHFSEIRHWLWWEHMLILFGMVWVFSVPFDFFKISRPDKIPLKPMLLLTVPAIPITLLINRALGWW